MTNMRRLTEASIVGRRSTGGTSDGRADVRSRAPVIEFGPGNRPLRKVEECVVPASIEMPSNLGPAAPERLPR